MKARDGFHARFGRVGEGRNAGALGAKLLAASVAALIALALPAAASAAPPTLTIDAPTAVETTKAHVSGEVSVPSDGNGSYWCFEYAEEGTGAWSGFCYAGYVNPGESVPVEADLTGLAAETSYEVRLAALDFVEYFEGSEAASATKTLTTDPAPVAPTATLDPAAEVAYTTAKIQGAVDPEGGNEEAGGAYVPIHWALQLSDSGDPGTFNDVTSGDLTGADAESDSPIAVPADPFELTNLTPDHTYTYRLLVTYAGQTVEPVSTDTFTTLAVAKPLVSVESAANVTDTAADFAGTVEVNGTDAAFNADCFFDYVRDGQFQSDGFDSASSVPCDPATVQGTASQPVSVSASATDLEPNTTYHLRLRATNKGGTATDVAATFATDAIGPGIGRETLWNPTPTSIQLNALVNAHNSVLSDCHFEWGTGGALDHSAPCEARDPLSTYEPPAGEEKVPVGARISGLSPSTEYSFRLVATNGVGTTQGDTRSFTTLAEPADQVCPNQAIRAAQGATQLPDCRAYEMATPLQKGNGDIVGDGMTNYAAVDGNAITFSTRTPFGDSIGSGVSGQTQYVARRGANGWSSNSITPQPRPDAYQTVYGATRYQAFAEDLKTAMLFGYDLPAATDDLPVRNNIYVEDLVTRSLRTVTTFANGLPEFLLPPHYDLSANEIWGVSADARHVAFVSTGVYVPGAAAGGNQNVYQWDDGVLSLAGILPDGNVPSGGSISPVLEEGLARYREAMSKDGSRLLFKASAGGNQQLYQRIDGERTVWISETELKPSDPNYQPDPSGVTLNAATPDGRNVFFTTGTPLLSEDTNGAPDLYRWTDSANPASDDNLTRITQNNFDGGEVIGTSDDGERVYYWTTGAQIVVWDHGATRVIIDGRVGAAGNRGERLSATASGPGMGRVTPDGRYLAFGSGTSFFTPDGRRVGPMGEEAMKGFYALYFYSLDNDTLRCVSCPSGPVTPGVTVTPTSSKAVIEVVNTASRPRFLSKGGKVFFSTTESLVPGDVNGAYDTYQYDPATGSVDLLASGKSGDAITFTDASASGDDVFVVTRQQLAPSDTDNLIDLYDVRVGGGFVEPIEPASDPCAGERCQGTAGQAPPIAAPASQAQGRGNPHPRRPRCHKRKKGGKQVAARQKRCVRHAKTHHKRANADRRAAK